MGALAHFEMPSMAMSGGELALSLMRLVDELIEDTETLTSVPVNAEITRDGSEKFNEAGNCGAGSLPYIRALIGRYTTLFIAKENPDWEGETPLKVNPIQRFQLDSIMNISARELSHEIKKICGNLARVDFAEITETLRRLDLFLAMHAQACGEIWPKLYAKARECDALP